MATDTSATMVKRIGDFMLCIVCFAFSWADEEATINAPVASDLNADGLAEGAL